MRLVSKIFIPLLMFTFSMSTFAAPSIVRDSGDFHVHIAALPSVYSLCRRNLGKSKREINSFLKGKKLSSLQYNGLEIDLFSKPLISRNKNSELNLCGLYILENDINMGYFLTEVQNITEPDFEIKGEPHLLIQLESFTQTPNFGQNYNIPNGLNIKFYQKKSDDFTELYAVVITENFQLLMLQGYYPTNLENKLIELSKASTNRYLSLIVQENL